MPDYQVLGIGAPCVDYILKVSDAYLDSILGRKEGMETVDSASFSNIVKDSHTAPILVAGGSCCNAIKGLANLGRKCAFHGKIGNDPAARYFFQSIAAHKIHPLLIESDGPTTQIACLINSEGRRTLRAYLGASAQFTAEELNPSYFEGVQLVHIEGYTLLNGSLTQRAMELAKAAGAKISFDASSFEVVETFKGTMIELIQKYVDVLFSNQKEALALTQKSSGKEACDRLKAMCKTAIVMVGENGCYVGKEDQTIYHPALKVQSIDTTGAGDLFASGFLHRYLENAPLQACAQLGTLLAAEVIQTLGAEIPRKE
jgi:sugar/nucleoside kinase (ribokinase family)